MRAPPCCSTRPARSRARATTDPARARALAELARELFEAVDKATRDWEVEPPQQVEVQVPGGAVFASRTPRWTLAVVARRAALSSLMFCDLRAVLGELDGAPPIRRARPAGAGRGPATDEQAAVDLPLPELGGDGGDGEPR